MTNDEILRRADTLISRVANDDAIQAIGITPTGRVVILDDVPVGHNSHMLVRTRAGFVPLVCIDDEFIASRRR